MGFGVFLGVRVFRVKICRVSVWATGWASLRARVSELRALLLSGFFRVLGSCHRSLCQGGSV